MEIKLIIKYEVIVEEQDKIIKFYGIYKLKYINGYQNINLYYFLLV